MNLNSHVESHLLKIYDILAWISDLSKSIGTVNLKKALQRHSCTSTSTDGAYNNRMHRHIQHVSAACPPPTLRSAGSPQLEWVRPGQLRHLS